jgi:hypothetical protein
LYNAAWRFVSFHLKKSDLMLKCLLYTILFNITEVTMNNYGKSLIGVTVTLLVLSIISVGARGYDRWKERQFRWLGDGLVMVALVSFPYFTALFSLS